MTDVNWIVIRFTLLYFRMAVIPLVPETKMMDVSKLISLENLLVRKVTWFVLTTTSVPLILSRAFGANRMTRIAYIYSRLPRTYSLSNFFFQRQHSLFFISTSRNSLILSVSKTQLNTRNMDAYTFCDLFLSCSAFSVRLVPASNTVSEISSNPGREKQPKWEKTHSS